MPLNRNTGSNLASSGLCGKLANLALKCAQNFSQLGICEQILADYESCAQPQLLSMGISVPVSAVLVTLLVMLSGLFSGLTLGLLSLDISELNVLINARTKKYEKYARRVLVVRKHGNWLLCTLLLGNVGINAALTVLMDNLFENNPYKSFAISATLIAFFGEILPQAICTRWAMPIGYYSVPIVMVIMAVLSPLAWPLGKFFDIILGKEIGLVFTNEELKELIEIHITQKEAELCEDEGRIIKGALDFLKLTVQDVMTPWRDVFHLHERTRLTFDVLLTVFKSGYSRIPVLNSDGLAVGILFAKDLLLIDPEDETLVSAVMRLYGRRLDFVQKADGLKNVMAGFTSGKSHLAIVSGRTDERVTFAEEQLQNERGRSRSSSSSSSERGVRRVMRRWFGLDAKSELSSSGVKKTADSDQKPPNGNFVGDDEKSISNEELKNLGIVTLEDIVEKILNFDIVDETDVYVNTKNKNLVKRDSVFDVSKLNVFDYRRALPRVTITPPEITAARKHLANKLSAQPGAQGVFDPLTLKLLLRLGKVSEVVVNDELLHDDSEDISTGGLVLYQRGHASAHCSIVLDGKLEVRPVLPGGGAKVVSRWEVLGAEALLREASGEGDFVPDFDAKVVEHARIFRVSRKDLREILDLREKKGAKG